MTGTRGRRRSSARATPARGPYPGVLLVCHACFPLPQTTENVGLWYWAAESLAEAGYVVLYATVGGNSASRTIDATDFLTATPASPTARGEFNPWYRELDRSRLAIVGHSGAAGVALDVGNTDPRYKAIVAWDPAASFAFTGVTPRVPTMIQVADYTLSQGPVPRAQRPVPAPGSKYTFFDTIRAAGVDVMQIAPRASTHLDWTHFAAANPFGPSIDHGVYGEMVATYYTLAWLDRYVAPLGAAPSGKAGRQTKAEAKQALRRLTASGTDRFDRSADAHSIGSGFFDAGKAKKARNPEAGNVPITIGGLPIRNLLSFQYASRYSLDGGALHCETCEPAARDTPGRASSRALRRSDRGFDHDVEGGRAAVGHAWLVPRFDRERHVDQRVAELEEVAGVVGEVVEGELLEIRRGVLEAGEGGVVERLQLVHGAREALGVALAFGGEGPVGERFEVGELGGQRARHAVTCAAW